MIVLQGVERTMAALEAKHVQMQAALRKATGEALHLIEKAAKDKLTTSSHPPKTPTPSMPGDPPSLVTGNLRRSIKVTGPTSTGTGWMGMVGPTAIYGRAQELGYEPRNLPARPYMRPALDDAMPKILALYKAALTEVILK